MIFGNRLQLLGRQLAHILPISPAYAWIPGTPRPPLKGNDTVHASAFDTGQVERRRKRNPKLQGLLDQRSCPTLMPLEVLAQKCWPGAEL